MTCREMTEFLAEYVAGELPAVVLSEFERHITNCGDCGVFIEQYQTTIRAGAAAFREQETPLPDALVAAILAAIAKQD